MALTDIAINPATGGLDTRGGLRLTRGPDTVAQHIRQMLITRLGELPYDTTKGVDWFGTILVKNPNLALVQAEILRVVRDIGGVEAITNYTQALTPSTRTLNVSFRVVTTEGDVQAEILADPARAAEAARLGGALGLADELERQGSPALAALVRQQGITQLAPTLAQHPTYSSLSTLRDTEEWLPFLLLVYPATGGI